MSRRPPGARDLDLSPADEVVHRRITIASFEKCAKMDLPIRISPKLAGMIARDLRRLEQIDGNRNDDR